MGEGNDPDVDAAIVQLARWSADAKTDAAADRKTREHWARQQAADEATLASALAGLVEHRVTVAIRTSNGSTVRGALAGLGVDYLAVVQNAHLTLLPLAAVGWVRPDGDSTPAAFADRVPATGRLGAVLAGVAEDGGSVRVVASGEALAGDLVAVGADVLTLHPAGAPRGQLLYVPLASLSEVSVRLSG